MDVTPRWNQSYDNAVFEASVCQYSPSHKMEGVPATTTLPHPVLGEVPGCQACADFYARMA
jgi:hypothetical protein